MENAVNTTDTPGQNRYESLMAAAVDVLTEAARTIEKDGQKLDFGAFLSHALATAAANLGGVHHLIEGRPGSWESADVHHLAGGDMTDVEWLAPSRTTPVVVGLNIEEAIDRMGHYAPDRRKWIPAVESYFDQLAPIDDRYDTDTDDEATWAEYESAAQDLERRWNRRYERYAAAFAEAVRGKAAELRITAPTYVEVVTDPELWSSNDMPQNPELYGAGDQIVETLWETAFEKTPTSLLTEDGTKGQPQQAARVEPPAP